MIAIIDYGMGNLLSVQKAFEYLGEDAVIADKPAQVDTAERLVLPGVGAFPDAMVSLERLGWIELLNRDVLKKGKPFLGICLGMQLLAETGEENRSYRGLGWINGRVTRFVQTEKRLKIPHVGWNDIKVVRDNSLLKDIRTGHTFYFVHSYHMVCDDPDDVTAVCDYGGEFTAAIQKNNIFATQFHPEKSQDNGIKILENFVSLNV